MGIVAQSQVEVVAALRDIARRATEAADGLAQSDPADFTPGASAAERAEQAEGIRCAGLLASRALRALHCLASPGDDWTLERSARAARAGWEAVRLADEKPADPHRHEKEPGEPNEDTAPRVCALFAALWLRRHPYEAEGKHAAHNNRVLLEGILREVKGAYPEDAPSEGAKRNRLLQLAEAVLVAMHGPEVNGSEVARRLGDLATAWFGAEETSREAARKVVTAELRGGVRVPAQPRDRKRRKTSGSVR